MRASFRGFDMQIDYGLTDVDRAFRLGKARLGCHSVVQAGERRFKFPRVLNGD
jgi:hypothetical protein